MDYLNMEFTTKRLKMKTTALKKILLTLLLTGVASTASAGWALKNTESTLNFISVKKSKIAEVHHFKNIEGSVDDSGLVTVSVKMDSLETNIPIRNERMQKFLFETSQFPLAKVSTQIDNKEIDKLKVGDSFSKKLAFNISIHGHEQVLNAEMRVTLLAGNKLLVSTIKPTILNLSQFALMEGIEKLKALAKLPSISSAVPVTASFIFEK